MGTPGLKLEQLNSAPEGDQNSRSFKICSKLPTPEGCLIEYQSGHNGQLGTCGSPKCLVGAGRPIRVEFLVPMEGHSDDDRDASDGLDEELPEMYEDSASDDVADPRCRIVLPSRFLWAKQQEENGEEDWYESDSE